MRLQQQADVEVFHTFKYFLACDYLKDMNLEYEAPVSSFICIRLLSLVKTILRFRGLKGCIHIHLICNT